MELAGPRTNCIAHSTSKWTAGCRCGVLKSRPVAVRHACGHRAGRAGLGLAGGRLP